MCPTPSPHEIQGDIAPGFRRSYHRDFHQTFVPLTIAENGEARRALQSLAAGPITWSNEISLRGRRLGGTGSRMDERPDVNIAFTSAGLRALKPELGEQMGSHPALSAGLAARTSEQRLLGSPEGWVVGAPDQPIHAVLHIGSTRAHREQVDLLLSSIGAGFTEVPVACGRIEGEALPGGFEHFGFRDGLSTPAVEIEPSPDTGLRPLRSSPSLATYVDGDELRALYGMDVISAAAARRREAPPTPVLASAPRLPLGQFIVEDEGFWHNGSFMVWLRLRQRVDKFRAACTRIAAKLTSEWGRDVSDDEAAALLVGRRRDGTSLALSGLHDVNEFSYRQASRFSPDPRGVRCPLGAHSRKMNPRSIDDSIHQVVRRGIPYGPVDGDDDTDRGLLFVAYQSSIEDQFEVLQGLWANSATAPEPAGSADAMISTAARDGTTFEIPNPSGKGSVGVKIRNDWIVPTGGLYLFVPSRRAIGELVEP